MVLTSLLALAFSLLPFLPHALGASPQAVWRISSVAFLIGGSAAGWLQFRYVRRVGTSRFGSLFVNLPLGILVLILLAFNSIFELGKLSPGIYLFGLLSLLWISGSLFLLTFLSFLGDRES